MPPWVDFLLKAGPLVGAVILGLLQLYFSAKFGEFREKIDQKFDHMEAKIEAKYPAKDIIDLMFKALERRVRVVERQVNNAEEGD